MKVKISETVDVTDNERRAIAQLNDGGTSRKCTRDEARAFIWKHGRDWQVLLGRAPSFEQDLIGDVDEDLRNLI